MQQLEIGNFTFRYDTLASEICSRALTPAFFVEEVPMPEFVTGVLNLSVATFYQSDCPMLKEVDYGLTAEFLRITQHFPHANPGKVQLTEEASYEILAVPVFIPWTDFLQAVMTPKRYPAFWQNFKKMTELHAVWTHPEEVLSYYKYKRLALNGHFGQRQFLAGIQSQPVQSIQDKLMISRELYNFAFYSYAAMVAFKPEFGIDDYDAFHEAYGQFIYSCCLKKGNQTLPLLWPDYLYHKPDGHLEFGVPAHSSGKRYAPFMEWQAGEKLTIEILAEGFEDVILETVLKPHLSPVPRLDKRQYQVGEKIIWHLNAPLIEELIQEKCEFTVLHPNGEKNSGYQLPFKFEGVTCEFQPGALKETGRYQFAIQSEKYGEMLFLFAIK